MPTMDDLATAVETDHPCNDSHCDIRAMLELGYADTAAAMLESATSYHDALDAWFAAGGTLPRDFRESPNWPAWIAWHRERGRECPACQTYNWPVGGEMPGQCGNCLAAL